jgi:hypothetical protein
VHREIHVIHDRSVPFYDIDSENCRLANNRQEFVLVVPAKGAIMAAPPGAEAPRVDGAGDGAAGSDHLLATVTNSKAALGAMIQHVRGRDLVRRSAASLN